MLSKKENIKKIIDKFIFYKKDNTKCDNLINPDIRDNKKYIHIILEYEHNKEINELKIVINKKCKVIKLIQIVKKLIDMESTESVIIYLKKGDKGILNNNNNLLYYSKYITNDILYLKLSKENTFG